MLSALVLALGTIAGGLSLMLAPMDPFGNAHQSLKDTPFADFLSGIDLFVCIRLFFLLYFYNHHLTSNISPIVLVAQGLILFIWMVGADLDGEISLFGQLIFLLFGIKKSWFIHGSSIIGQDPNDHNSILLPMKYIFFFLICFMV
ncbi:MAG: hypothetical protein IPF46_00005 [Saprospiraceae bacterium]|nr:hypothetical protein [Candidatus Vicinibacter affinis]